jgi:hypothetical protein
MVNFYILLQFCQYISEDRRQKSEVRGRRSEVRGQYAVGRKQKSEDRSQETVCSRKGKEQRGKPAKRIKSANYVGYVISALPKTVIFPNLCVKLKL